RPGRFLGFCDDIERAGGGIDHRRSRDSDLRVDVAGFSGVTGGYGGDARPEEALLPVLDTRPCIGVKSEDTVVLGGYENNIVRAARYREVRDVERLGIDLAVHGAREQLAEGRRSHVGRSQYGFIRILTGPEVVVAMREHSGVIGARC